MRRILWASLALTPLVLIARFVLHAGPTVLFVLAALALLPLAWLIGEATEHAAAHTGDGVGGFLNASFGNAPELIIALFAIADGLPNVVRGAITGSVVSNILLVLGIAMFFGRGGGKVDTRSLALAAPGGARRDAAVARSVGAAVDRRAHTAHAVRRHAFPSRSCCSPPTSSSPCAICAFTVTAERGNVEAGFLVTP